MCIIITTTLSSSTTTTTTTTTTTIIIIIIIIVIIIIITTTILIINKLMVVFFYLAFILSLNKLSCAVLIWQQVSQLNICSTLCTHGGLAAASCPVHCGHSGSGKRFAIALLPFQLWNNL